MSNESNYKEVSDGYHNAVSPAYISVVDDKFNEDSTQIELAFSFGDGFERPVARIPFIFGPKHMIAEFENGQKIGEHRATEEDQRNAINFIARVFPAWAAFCKEEHTLDEKLNWFEECAVEAKGQTMDIKVSHRNGFPNAYVLDPEKSKKSQKPKVMKSAVMTRAKAALSSVFGPSTEETDNAPSEGSGDLPF